MSELVRDATTVIIPRDGSAGRFSPGLILGGRYRIVSMLGRGGMGEVYRADDLKLGQAVALKFLPEALRASEDDRARLYREARAGREVTHPNVCRLYDVVEIDQHIFISMEYVDGEDLASLLPRIGRFSTDKALAIARDVCAGLAAAHEKGIVHADLKPANIMIDGRGRALITDFGLAALAFDPSQRGMIAGTPRYMAPEQFAGVLPSTRTDIYALGLVMAEVFTGCAVLEGGSVGEIREQQKRAEQFSVPGVDERIDSVIRACLQQNAGQRPKSVDEILERLPPRDPLAAAMAAGETPSPGMVAQAEESGELSRTAAALSFAAAIAGLFAVAFFAGRTMLYERAPVLPPEVLETNARALLQRNAPGLPVADSESWMSAGGADEFVVEGISMQTAAAQTGPLLFHVRTSPEALAARNTEFRVIDNDPPFDRPGMSRVILDQSGRLIELAIVPPRQERGGQAILPVSSWSPLLDASGATRVTPVQSEWAAPTDTDAKFAWKGFDARTGAPMHLEAAAYHGRPVWFFAATSMPQRKTTTINRIATTMNILFAILIPIVGILLALRNIRRGHGDLRGATKLALFVGCSSFVTMLLRAHHPASLFDEWLALSLMVAYAAFWAAVVWGAYIAAEPLVRRRWPRMMIGWARLLAGRWRDPMIGRETLAGVCTAVAVLLAWHASVLLSDGPPLALAITPLGSGRHVAYYFVRALGEAALRAMGAAVVLLAFRVLVRNRYAAGALTILVLMLSFLGDTTAPPAFRVAYALFAACAVLFILTRFGVFSVGICAGAIIVMRTMPVTLDVSKWYFSRGFLAIAAVIVLAVAGYLVSLGTKSVLPPGALEMEER